MGNERNLQELIAAMNGGDNSPSASRGFPISPAQSSMQSAPSQAQPNQLPQTNPPHPAQYNTNYTELVNLLGDQTTAQQPAIPQSAAHQTIPVASFPNAPSNIVPQSQFSQHQQHPPTAHKQAQPAAAARKPASQSQPQQSAVSQAQRATQQKRQNSRLGINAGLPPVMADRQPNAAPNAQASTPAAAAAAAAAANAAASAPTQGRPRNQQLTAAQRQHIAAAAARQGGVQQPSARVASNANAQSRSAGTTPQQLAAAAAHRARNRQITQEQVIVGHFCRHSIKTLSRIMQGNPLAEQTEVRLKEHIRVVWAQWVRGVITRTQLLDSVASFVRGTCREATNIDVVREFKSWYEREFEMQRQRSGAEPAGGANRAALTQQQRARTANQAQLPQQQIQMNARTAQAVPMKPTGADPVKPEVAVPAAQPGVKTGVAKTKQEAALLHSSTAGKSLASAAQSGRPAAGRGGGATSKVAASKAAAVKAAAAKVGAGRGVAGKSVAGKTVGGKGVVRQTPVHKPDPSVGRVPNAAGPLNNVPTGVIGGGDVDPNHQAGRPRVAGKTISGPAKAPGGKKKSAVTKVSPKGTQAKSVAKGSPVSAGRGKPPVLGEGAAGAAKLVGDKRMAAEMSVGSSGSASPASKKSKTIGKPVKPAPGRPKVNITSDTEPLVNAVRAPPPNAESLKKAAGLAKKVIPGAAGGTAAGGHAQKSTAGAGASNATAVTPGAPGAEQKKVKRVDDELVVTNGLVDFEAEEDQMGLGKHDDEVVVVEDDSYSDNMVLAGAKLRSKMQRIAKRHGLNDRIRKDVLEMVSLAVEERLRLIVDGLKESANMRTLGHVEMYETVDVGMNVYEKMEQMREDEERLLVLAAESRVKRRNEKKEQELRKLNGDAGGSEKKKETNATSEAERKEKLAQEKKRKEHSSQRDALSGLLAGIDKRRKKPNSGKGLAPLAPLGGLEPLGKGKGLGGLPPIQKRGSESGGSGKDKTAEQLEKLNALGPLTKLGRKGASEKGGGGGAAGQAREPLRLADVIFFLENEVNSRKSALLYKLYARLGTLTH